ncbi:MAG: hypothetical protein HOK98_15380 [Rhodospirillaceae bacterium]|jgi:hypothetical protein|nr:hypothetical protein [Rhodospirillaceae bacterium]MBT6537554.1 hypothetical protein [Rhodospirillaceae bacterium]
MTDKGKAAGGGRLNRSETVTVRLDPRLNYLCELAARTQRRTKSSFIETAIAEALLTAEPSPFRRNGSPKTIGSCADQLWHVHDHQRLARLAGQFPHLLTIDEQEIWALICDLGHLWSGHWEQDGSEEVWRWETRPWDNLQMNLLHEFWLEIVATAGGDDKALERINQAFGPLRRPINS